MRLFRAEGVARVLPAVVFCAGAASLAVEICASRLLAPYFGNSTVVWANVIGLILIYLSVGYWLGGRIADRHPQAHVLGLLLVLAALATAVLPFVARPFLDLALRGFAAVSVGAVAGSFVATLLLFAIPVSLLGMASPFALRLSIREVERAGATSGRLSALATVGAIVGTFGAALLLIPAIGTQRTMLAAALLVAVISVPLWLRGAAPATALIAVLIALPPGVVKPQVGTLAERQTLYQFVQVVRTPDGKVVMRTDEGVADQSVYRAGTVLTGGEWDMPLVVPPLLQRPVRSILVIGNAGGTTARALAGEYPGVRIDGVEIDPVLSDLGRQYMGMSAIPKLDVITADGRAFLKTTASTYDLIVVDAYRQTYIPFYLTTVEFFQLVRAHLNSGGGVALNVERVPGDDRLVQAVSGTLAGVFPQTWVWPALHFNELVVGLDTPIAASSIATRLQGLPAAVRVLAPLVVSSLRTVAPTGDPLTDDHAPVEWLTDRAVLAYIAAGGRLDEQLLPTAP
ncbi:MAG: fused MFS/spermidine synthase [Candidatus Dormibacteraeota bacterium]|nr:fused MFS/spermidine synthase [Candidatus Dormibacteraeota bacterium]MBV9525041.1 fused MFS/spermidine synthase [Candidatus Dormibacteraeota bacterium]